MTDFEDDLRRRLAVAAGEAPAWRADLLPSDPEDVRDIEDAGTAAPGRPRRPVWLAAAAAAAVVVGGGAWWVAAQPPTSTGSASCAGVLRYQGAQYVQGGPLQSLPSGITDAGGGTLLGCDDGGGATPDEAVTVQALPDVAPARAVVIGGDYWLADGQPAPDALQRLLQPVPCTGDGTLDLRGTAASIDTEVDAGVGPAVPYTLGVTVDGGDVPGGFARTTIDVAVTAATRGGDDRALVVAALQDGARVRVTARCQGTGYEAVSLTRG
ncbi:hypothetical protein [Nostocoides sp. Soil756]|jgi:hypothetical protein|uniref:hypothetical protein n=1 Tax=Nostocoides sp. Soil756 TaxID=1736399 RepID=UPI0006FAFDE6|nr:hypothetical protein [Tetrasphaera sp. Soil756]KRE62461.1 hypothetical protein ASG78_05395 [Tetrasphaera sp. Soil756]